MKRLEKLFIVLAYMFFVYPPFILGLVTIFARYDSEGYYLQTLYANLILIVVILAALGIMIWRKVLHKPSGLEIRYLIFGLIGNILVYLYTFQNALDINDYVTTYLLVILVLGFHGLLITKKLQSKEMWILMTAFAFIDYSRLIITSCGFLDLRCTLAGYREIYGIAMGITSVLVIFGYYIYRIITLKHWSILKIINVVLVTVLSVWLLLNRIYNLEKFFGVLLILTPFFMILDYVVSIVNKTYSAKTTVFYLRTITLLVYALLLSGIDFLRNPESDQVLIGMIIITYVSLLITIISSTSRVSNDAANLPTLRFRYVKATEADMKLVQEELQIEMSFEGGCHYYLVLHQNLPVGLLKYDFNVILLESDYINQCNLHEIFVKSDFIDILPLALIKHLEHELKLNQVYQIRGDIQSFHIDFKTLMKQDYVFLDQNQFLKKIL